jgi:hypothetical protein
MARRFLLSRLLTTETLAATRAQLSPIDVVALEGGADVLHVRPDGYLAAAH